MTPNLEKIFVDGVLTMKEIEIWLSTFSNRYKRTYTDFYSKDVFCLENGSTVRLPTFGKKREQEKFLDLYQALETISQFHRNEEYFEQEVIIYHKIKESKADLKAWTSKNEELGANKYVCFFLDYLDYDEDEKVEHLNVFVPSLKNINLFADRKDFIHTIKFLEIFNDLYWVQEILPESLARMRKTD